MAAARGPPHGWARKMAPREAPSPQRGVARAPVAAECAFVAVPAASQRQCCGSAAPEAVRLESGVRQRRGQPLSRLRCAVEPRGPLTERGRGAMEGVGRRLRTGLVEPRP